MGSLRKKRPRRTAFLRLLAGDLRRPVSPASSPGSIIAGAFATEVYNHAWPGSDRW
jgi:hypothetical protein